VLSEYTGIPDLAGIYWNTRRTNNKCKTNNADRIYIYIYINTSCVACIFITILYQVYTTTKRKRV